MSICPEEKTIVIAAYDLRNMSHSCFVVLELDKEESEVKLVKAIERDPYMTRGNNIQALSTPFFDDSGNLVVLAVTYYGGILHRFTYNPETGEFARVGRAGDPDFLRNESHNFVKVEHSEGQEVWIIDHSGYARRVRQS